MFNFLEHEDFLNAGGAKGIRTTHYPFGIGSNSSLERRSGSGYQIRTDDLGIMIALL